MSLRGLLVLIGLLAVVVFALLRLGRGAGSPEAPAEAPLVKAFAEEAVRTIDLACAGTTVTLGREAARGWRITRPVDAEADPRRVHEVLAALADARVRKVIADTFADRAAFGLRPAACSVALGFGTEAEALTLRLGRASPVGSERYAAVDDVKVVLTDGSLYGVVARGADAFRENRLIPVDPEGITRIRLDRPDGRLVVARIEDAWRLEAPLADTASSFACDALARAIASIELTDAGPVRPPVDARTDRRLRLEVTARGETTPRVAYVAAAGIGGKRLGWREGHPLAGLVEESALGELTRTTESFRESRIASFSSPDVRRITVERAGLTLRIERASESAPWTGASGSVAFPVDGARVAALIDRLRALTGAGFEPGAPAANATGTIAVSGERGELARLRFGPLPATSGSSVVSVWVTTPARPGAVFRVDATALGPIPASAADLAVSGS